MGRSFSFWRLENTTVRVLKIFIAIASTWLAAACASAPVVTPPIPQAPAMRAIAVVVTDGDERLVGALVTLNDITPPGPHTGATDATGVVTFLQVSASIQSTQVTVSNVGCQPYVQTVTLTAGIDQQVDLGGSLTTPNAVMAPALDCLAQPVARAPLVLEGNDPDGTICHAAQLVTFPSTPQINFWRGDAWGVTVPGLPMVPGGSSIHPERALSWFLDRDPTDFQGDILDQNRLDGYTHFTLSWPDSRAYGTSVADYVALALKVKASIPFVNHMLTSKVYDPPNADAPTRMAAVTPVLDALQAAGALDIMTVGWELDSFNDPVLLQDFIDVLSARYPGVPLYVHFTTYHTAWQPNGQSRAQFWQTNQGKLTGLLYQANQNDPCGLMEAHFNDALDAASGLTGFVVVPWELVGANEFDGTNGVDENFANARSWELMATPGSIVPSGFGNGSRLPSGQETLSAYPEP